MDLAERSDRVAATLAVGDRCGADEQADELLEDVVAAVNDGEVPQELAEELASATNALAERIECPAEPPPPPPSTESDTTGDDEEEPDETVGDDEDEEDPPPPPPPPPPPEEPVETVPTETETVPTDTVGETTTTTGTTTQEAP